MLTCRQLYRLLIASTIAIVATTAKATTGRLFTSDRLTSSMVNSVCQDRYGFVWIGTENGLNKYDGYTFTNYMSADGDTTSLVSNEISAILTDSHGRLWVGCNYGLSSYDYATGKFRRYHFPNGRLPRVESIVENANGDLYIGTSGYGIFIKKRDSDRLVRENAFRRKPIDDFAGRLFFDDQGYLWRSSHLTGITRVKMKDGKPVAFKEYSSNVGPAISYLKESRRGILVVCMYGILRYDYSTGKLSDAGFDMSALSSKVSIRHAMIDHSGNIYIGTSGSGLMTIPNGSNRLIPFRDSNRDFNLATSNVNDIIEDKDHNIWICCYKKGVYQLSLQKDAFHTISFKSQNILLGSSVSSIALGNDGDTWMTVQKSGVYKADKYGKITVNPSVPDGSDFIYRDHSGNYWLCTENALFAYDPYKNKTAIRLHLDGWGVGAMADDGGGTLYISALGEGLTIFDIKSGKTRNCTMSYSHPRLGTVCNDWIKSLFVDSHGYLWIGTSNGISAMNTRTGSFRDFRWNILLHNTQGLSIGETHGGNILLGTDKGLFVYNRKTQKVERLPNTDRLKSLSIYSIAVDASDTFWFATAKGIWYYDQRTSKLISHVSGNGLTTRENVLGAAIMGNGQIVMANYDGLTTFFPKDVAALKNIVGNVMLTSIETNGHALDFRKKSFDLRHDENSLTLHFSQMNFKPSEETAFQYRINGSKEWTTLHDGSNSLSLNNLTAGKYEIEVRAANNGTYSLHPLKLTLDIAAPWYASTVAYFLYALFILSIVAFAISYYLRRRKAEMEEAKMQFLINATHDIRSPLTLIMGPLAKLKQRLPDQENQADIDTIERNAQRLLLLVNQILDKRKIDKHQMHLHCQKTDLVKFISGTCSMYQYNATQRNIAFRFNHPDDSVDAWIDTINFDKVVSNLLSNAFKFTPDGGEITIDLTQTEDKIVISVTDNGIGFGDQPTARLFERFQQGSNVKIGGTGIGLNLCQAIVKMHGGDIHAHNRTDGTQGACVVVVLKKGYTHLKAEELAEMPSEETRPAPAKRQAKKNLKIAVVDDNEEIARYIVNELSEWYSLDIYHDGEQAMKALLVGHYDLVVSDVMMPVMDGITLLKKIKRNVNTSHIPVILLTSKDDISDKLEGIKCGADAYIAKPFNMELLHVTIDNLTDNMRRLRGKFTIAQQQEERMEKIEVKGNDEALMDRVMDTINKHITEPDFNVEMLARETAVSRMQLHRKLKELMGITPSDLIRNQRLEQAARMLREHKVNVSQVAYAVGFTNQAHFSTIFKKQFGLTPTEYETFISDNPEPADSTAE